MECKQYLLEDLCEISSSKRIFASDYTSEGIPFYRSKEIIELSAGKKISNKLYISSDKYKFIKEKFGVPETGDILLTSVGTLGIPYIVGNNGFYFKDGNLTWFKNFKKDIVLNKFIFYWLTSSIAKNEIDKITIGSTQKALTISSLKRIPIILPSKKTQKNIVFILDGLNNKIKNNLFTIEILEQISQTLFKRWFIDFEFPN